MHIYIYMMPYWGGLTHPNCAGCVWQTAKGAATDIPLCKQHAHGSLTPPDCKARGLTWMQQVHKAHVLRAPPPLRPPPTAHHMTSTYQSAETQPGKPLQQRCRRTHVNSRDCSCGKAACLLALCAASLCKGGQRLQAPRARPIGTGMDGQLSTSISAAAGQSRAPAVLYGRGSACMYGRVAGVGPTPGASKACHPCYLQSWSCPRGSECRHHCPCSNQVDSPHRRTRSDCYTGLQ